ncbi:nucleotidyltransferase family protein [Clostridium sp. LIBA-8841]|uniref:nucleotidyltransferase family protein n=1 Tax=Clostridium sp. LIBA-8841 TaxID=2987530 RepID=UPI002ACD74E9|nr:NTP transferase domain-containing protein [Clostridium sp. LIBA-8841]
MLAIILASGIGKRMGENKLLLDFCGKPLVQWVIETVSSIGFNEVILVYRDPKVKEIAQKYGISTIYNEKANYGQSESIKISLEKSSDLSNGYMFFTGDQPLLKRETIIKLVQTFNDNGGIIVPKINGQNKSPTIFSSDFKDELMSLKGDIGGRPVIKNNLDKVFFVNFHSDIEFFDIDTKEELEYVRRKYNE